MDVVITRDSRWRHKKTKRVAVVVSASNASAFPPHRSVHGDGSDDAYADLAAEQRLADSQVGYRYIKKVGRSVQTVWIKRGAFLKTFEKTK